METSGWDTSTKCTAGRARFCGPGDTTGTIAYALSRALSTARRPPPNKRRTPPFCHHEQMPMLNLELEAAGWGTRSEDAWFGCVQTCKLERAYGWQLRRSDSPCGYATSRPKLAFMQPAWKSLHDIPEKLWETLERMETHLILCHHQCYRI